MRIANLAIAGSLLVVGLAGVAVADEALASGLRQPTSVYQTAFEYDNYLYFAPEDGTSDSPSDESAPAADQSPPADLGCAAACDGSCGRCRRRCDPCSLPQPRFLRCRGITVGGYLEQGISAAANQPADGFNGVVALNDRDGEYQMNQFAFYLDRAADTGGYGWDVGGNVTFIYGTDGFLAQAAGLEDNWGQTEPYYQAALPQFYLDVAYNDWTIRMGHFLSIFGHEVIPAPGNFFYSHAYTMVYGEPLTHTGVLVMYRVNDRLSASAGFHRGANEFEDTSGTDSIGFIGGVNWTSPNQRVALDFAITSGEETDLDADVLIYSLVGTFHLTDNLTYVLQHDYGQGVVTGQPIAEWYGLNQYLLYDINECWAAGVRFEWFRDDAGYRVTGARPHNSLNGSYFPGAFYEITAGLNWKPRENIIVRPEVRWDWYDAAGAAPATLPYDAGDRADQFLFGCDLIVTF